MERTITVKGVGAVSVKPDLIVVSMGLDSKDMDYEKSISIASNQINELRSALVNVGFNKEDLKTQDFQVDVSNKWIENKDGEDEEVFDGYKCRHRLKLEFDLDTKLLGKVLSAIASCSATPKLDIDFSVKNSTQIKAELLKRASLNAKQKAEILCESSGVKLGSLVTIDYNWCKINLTSRTRYVGRTYGCAPTSRFAEMDLTPDDIDAEDDATFVWEII